MQFEQRIADMTKTMQGEIARSQTEAKRGAGCLLLSSGGQAALVGERKASILSKAQEICLLILCLLIQARGEQVRLTQMRAAYARESRDGGAVQVATKDAKLAEMQLQVSEVGRAPFPLRILGNVG